MQGVCAVDVGTTRIKALLLTEEASAGPVASAPSVLSTPLVGAAEVDADALWAQVGVALRKACASGLQVAALVITNQRATVFLVDDEGQPLAPGLSWQDSRGTQALATWLGRVGRERFANATGLAPSALWSLAKILWWRERGLLSARARVATVQDWLLRRLGARDWVLDHANASLTGLLNVHSLTWDPELVAAAGLSPSQLPRLAPSGTRVGSLDPAAAAATGLPPGTPLILGGGDQQCADLGAAAVQPGLVGANLGTAGVISVPLDHVVIDPEGRLVCLAHVLPGRWVLEGLEETYGSAHEWGSELLGAPLVALAAEAPVGSRGLLFLPYLAGSGAPDYQSTARAALLGLALAHGQADIARAILEGTTIELVRIIDVAHEFVGVEQLIASGGGARQGLLLEMLANVAGVPVSVASHSETSLIGAGLLAWVGLGRWPSAEAAAATLPPARDGPAPAAELRAAYHTLRQRYQATLQALRQGDLLSPSREAQSG